MAIVQIGADKIHEVCSIAQITWPVAFGDILSEAQLAYMMDMMYRPDVLLRQMDEGHEFYVSYEDDQAIGFMGIEPNYLRERKVKIHKLYILPNQQGKGIGEKFVLLAEARCRALNCSVLTLNVNRYNKALKFYEKLNFSNIKTVDIEIGQGYLMEDYVLEKAIN